MTIRIALAALLLAATACAPVRPAPEAVPGTVVETTALPPPPLSVAPDPWAARIARSLGPPPGGEGEILELQRQDHERRALLVRGRDQADAIQGYLIDRGVELNNPDSSGHLLRMRTAIRLSAVGYTSQRIERLEAMHVGIVAAAVAASRRGTSFDQELLLAPDIVLAEALAPPAPADLGDGFESSQPLRVVERLRGGYAEGTALTLRLRQTDSGLEPGRRHLILPSGEAYRHAALVRGYPPSLRPGTVIQIMEPRHLEGELLVGAAGEAKRPLAEVRIGVAQLDAIDRELAPRLAPPPTRIGLEGFWLIDTVDGAEVDPWRYWVRLRAGVPNGGHDDCNWWGREGGQVVSTQVGCPPSPARAAYHAVLMSARPPAPVLQPDGSLLLAAAGHSLVFRRPLD